MMREKQGSEKCHLGRCYSGEQYSENRRQSTILFLIAAAAILAAVTVSGILLEERGMETDFARTNLTLSLLYLFGTDWMGRTCSPGRWQDCL